ncbi:TIGR03757 family integrating conjugative element protein [Marinobacterium rhizophilum]|uniref:TIGR03757 family integrating conjugative element protein n=1 Tax=Marinobacterium rhizophilum TaxID=420402 RepID=A0ABY5HJR0_9GAMM|nr:TIGR03757 family integrating conjugative element protein [Marinobacterium rhizophilum]UTW12354.1 TIGR03757 family integrating conjugative element protein [Marinobacterium rhizophilum]
MHPVHFNSRKRLTALTLLLVSGTATATEVWVITDSQHPVTGTRPPDRVIELDAPQGLEAQLSARLPRDPQHASDLAQQRLAQVDQKWQQRLQRAYQGVVDVWALGITKLPAVVVDRRYVVYGTSDLDQALGQIAHYRQEQP